VIGIPLIFYAGAAVQGDPWADSFGLDSPSALLVGLFLMAIMGPVRSSASSGGWGTCRPLS
jgi:hypothetical protein